MEQLHLGAKSVDSSWESLAETKPGRIRSASPASEPMSGLACESSSAEEEAARARARLCLEALSVALKAGEDGAPWYVSILELQLVSLPVCEACRYPRTTRVEVSLSTPRSLYTHDKREHSRVPPLAPLAVKWRLPVGLLWELSDRLAGLQSLVLMGLPSDVQDLSDAVWPRFLKRLVFGDGFNAPVDGLVLPASLRELEFGHDFNQRVDALVWPEHIRTVTFGNSFALPIGGVVWPTSLESLSFGSSFNGAIDDVAWPPRLQHLSFERDFTHGIEEAVWPSSLRTLKLGENFKGRVDRVEWPGSLEELTFGPSFHRAIDRIIWPRSLRRLTFEAGFSPPLNDVIWPPSLRELSFGPNFWQSLQTIGAWPENVEELELRLSELYTYAFSLGDFEWPPKLKKLILPVSISTDDIRFPPDAEVRFVALRVEGEGLRSSISWEEVGSRRISSRAAACPA